MATIKEKAKCGLGFYEKRLGTMFQQNFRKRIQFKTSGYESIKNQYEQFKDTQCGEFKRADNPRSKEETMRCVMLSRGALGNQMHSPAY